MDIKELPQPNNCARVETGPVQFGDDWPGIFIRGDDCLMYHAALYQIGLHLKKNIKENPSLDDIMSKNIIDGLCSLLAESNTMLRQETKND